MFFGRPAGIDIWKRIGLLIESDKYVTEVKVVGVKSDKVYVWKQPPGKDAFITKISPKALAKKQHAPYLIDPPEGTEDELPAVGDVGDPAEFSGDIKDIKPVGGATEVPMMTTWLPSVKMKNLAKEIKAKGLKPQDTFSTALATGEPLPKTFPEPVGLDKLPKADEPPTPPEEPVEPPVEPEVPEPVPEPEKPPEAEPALSDEAVKKAIKDQDWAFLGQAVFQDKLSKEQATWLIADIDDAEMFQDWERAIALSKLVLSYSEKNAAGFVPHWKAMVDFYEKKLANSLSDEQVKEALGAFKAEALAGKELTDAQLQLVVDEAFKAEALATVPNLDWAAELCEIVAAWHAKKGSENEVTTSWAKQAEDYKKKAKKAAADKATEKINKNIKIIKEKINEKPVKDVKLWAGWVVSKADAFNDVQVVALGQVYDVLTGKWVDDTKDEEQIERMKLWLNAMIALHKSRGNASAASTWEAMLQSFEAEVEPDPETVTDEEITKADADGDFPWFVAKARAFTLKQLQRVQDLIHFIPIGNGELDKALKGAATLLAVTKARLDDPKLPVDLAPPYWHNAIDNVNEMKQFQALFDENVDDADWVLTHAEELQTGQLPMINDKFVAAEQAEEWTKASKYAFALAQAHEDRGNYSAADYWRDEGKKYEAKATQEAVGVKPAAGPELELPEGPLGGQSVKDAWNAGNFALLLQAADAGKLGLKGRMFLINEAVAQSHEGNFDTASKTAEVLQRHYVHKGESGKASDWGYKKGKWEEMAKLPPELAPTYDKLLEEFKDSLSPPWTEAVAKAKEIAALFAKVGQSDKEQKWLKAADSFAKDADKEDWEKLGPPSMSFVKSSLNTGAVDALKPYAGTFTFDQLKLIEQEFVEAYTYAEAAKKYDEDLWTFPLAVPELMAAHYTKTFSATGNTLDKAMIEDWEKRKDKVLAAQKKQKEAKPSGEVGYEDEKQELLEKLAEATQEGKENWAEAADAAKALADLCDMYALDTEKKHWEDDYAEFSAKALAAATSPEPEPEKPEPPTSTVDEMKAKGVAVMPWQPKMPKGGKCPTFAQANSMRKDLGLEPDEFVISVTNEIMKIVDLEEHEYVNPNNGVVCKAFKQVKAKKWNVIETGKTLDDEELSAPPPGITSSNPLPESPLPPAPPPPAQKPAKNAAEVLAEIPLPKDFPKPDELTLEGSGSSMGGAGTKTIWVDKNGKKWIHKEAYTKGAGVGTPKPFSVVAQQVWSELAQKIYGEHIPVASMKLQGKIGTLQPLLELDDDMPDLENHLDPSKLSPEDRETIVKEQVLDWMTSQHDSHDRNWIKTKDGKLLSIDKEQGFLFFAKKSHTTGEWEFGQDKLDINYVPNSGEVPYVNRVWKGWINGDFDLDPKVLEEVLNKIQDIPMAEYIAMIRPYAETLWPGKPKLQKTFLETARRRKLDLRKDFEGFLTMVYRKKTGSDGNFTFAKGWSGATPDPAGPKVIKKKLSADQYLTKLGNDSGATAKTVPYKNFDTGKMEPDKITLKLAGSVPNAIDKLKKLAGELGLDVIGAVNGPHYAMIFVNTASWKAASIEFEEIEKPEPIKGGVAPTPAKPQYFPDDHQHPEATPNAEDLDKIQTTPLGRQGKRYESDGTAVEGSTMRAKKWQDSKGVYYHFNFKLRPQVWQQFITGGKSKYYAMPVGNFDDSLGSYVKQGTANLGSTSCRYWKVGDSEVYLSSAKRVEDVEYTVEKDHYGDVPKWKDIAAMNLTHGKNAASEKALRVANRMLKGQPELGQTIKYPGFWTCENFSYIGMVWAHIRPAPGETPKEALAKALNAVQPGLAGEVLRNATDEEKELRRLGQILWSVDPQMADAISTSYYSTPEDEDLRTPEMMRQFIQKAGLGAAEENVTLEEVFPGYSSYVEKGRLKRMQDNGYRYSVQGIGPEYIVSIVTTGLLGISERTEYAVGKPNEDIGISETADVRSGSADGALSYMVPEAKFHLDFGADYPKCAGQPFAKGTQAIIHPKEIERLDVYHLWGDSYGTTDPDGSCGAKWVGRQPLEKAIKKMGSNFGTNETSFRRGVPPQSILRITTSDEYKRKQMISSLLGADIVEVNGVPVEDFIVVEQNMGEVYRKYVEPFLMEAKE